MTGFQVVTVGVSTYPQQTEWNLNDDTLTASTRLVADELAHHGAMLQERSSAAQDLVSLNGLQKELVTPKVPCLWYWVGHGEYSDDGYFAALATSTEPLGSANSVPSRLFAETIRDRYRARGDEADWFVVVLDTCGSSPGAAEIVQTLKGSLPPNTAIIATSTDGGTANLGEFAQLLQEKLRWFPEEPEIKVAELVRRLEESLDIGGQHRPVHARLLPTAVIPRRAGLPMGLTTTVETYQELEAVLATADEATRNHFFPKARGAEISEPAWYFTGRETERRQIAQWLHETESGLFVVTGEAGSGKSALLGMLLASTDPAITSALERMGYPTPAEDLLPPEHAFDAALHLSGATVGDAIGSLAGAIGVPEATDADALAAQAATAAAQRPRTLLLDALDESRDAVTIGALVRRLSNINGLRLVVGTRQSLHESPDHPEPPDRAVLTALGADQENTLTLDRDAGAIKEYTNRRLRDLFADRLTETRIAELATQIADQQQPFLFSRLALHELKANPHLTEPDAAADLQALLNSGHTGIFAHAVKRLAELDPRIEALLHALAYARGNGLPHQGGIWATAASALSGLTVTDEHVSRTLDAAAPYIMQGEEFGHTVYRLAHRTFTERYRLDDAAQC